MIPVIQMTDFLKLKDIAIIDIRSSRSYNNNHIEGSINIPYELLIVYPERYLLRNKKYYIYCQKGVTSKKVVSILNNRGYNTVSIQGGYEEWIMEK